eukprot:CAMPEP_0201238306 /NCGR_PEP_ID=MMETSP0852-20130820/17656_1 /ASSEMBLY_ACC=CAM_ASM_000632 /TAXON_ID=183588 /ORGANISM="Pseudo-nitzschia fraudulenta, Strain WWA7" /LENGTH=50 /DNA_ID=CAMNT_0047533107 /DNA_START=79 /DNA_END=228 /DNA_ORIENTATION=-
MISNGTEEFNQLMLIAAPKAVAKPTIRINQQRRRHQQHATKFQIFDQQTD